MEFLLEWIAFPQSGANRKKYAAQVNFPSYCIFSTEYFTIFPLENQIEDRIHASGN
jgi:hypothetical protein